MWAKLQKIAQKLLFWAFSGIFDHNKANPLKTNFRKTFSLYVSVSVKFYVKPMSISEDISVLTVLTQLPIFPVESS